MIKTHFLMIHKKKEEISVYECSISDKVKNWMYRLHFNVLFFRPK